MDDNGIMIWIHSNLPSVSIYGGFSKVITYFGTMLDRAPLQIEGNHVVLGILWVLKDHVLTGFIFADPSPSVISELKYVV